MNLLATPQSKHKMEDRATFDVVVLCGLVISKLLTSIDEPSGATKIASLVNQERITGFKNKRCICKKRNGSSCVIQNQNPHAVQYAYLCCTGGMPSFSSTRSLILSIVSVGSMSISISFPVRVLTLIIVPPLSLRTK